jgi:hypothetical protein
MVPTGPRSVQPFFRCGDGVHRRVGGDLPGSAVPRRVPSGVFSQQETILSCFGKHRVTELP